ncbi:MAG: hypothetical protein NTU60_07640 [Candidatus Aminicenantes bacterium]|nr:hypothetical protein [Candidatus Aminicenantes bacterium]
MKAKYAVFSIILVTFSVCCQRRTEPLVPLLENKQPIHTYGAENSGHYYKAIDNYTVDQNGNTFLWDSISADCIDVYNYEGQFLYQFGRKGQGPEEFRAVGTLAVDAKGNNWISSGNMKSLKVFSERGEYKEDVLLPKEFAVSYIQKMVFNTDDDLFLMCSFIGNMISLYRFDHGKNQCQLIHSESKRIKTTLANFRSDFALDVEGNIYIIDTVDYRIYKYAKDGKLLFTFEVPVFKKDRIVEEDFNVFADSDFKIIRFPRYKEIMDVLRGPSQYFPAIFGINIDRDTIYVWTSKQDEMKRFMIDVYDMSFKKKSRSCYFNSIRHNMAQMIKGRLYIPSIENENIQVTKNAGRFTMLNFADQLNVYAISNKLRNRQ